MQYLAAPATGMPCDLAAGEGHGQHLLSGDVQEAADWPLLGTGCLDEGRLLSGLAGGL